MPCANIEELDLLTFFEVSPKIADPGVPWPYNDFLYEVQRGEFSISFAIVPAYPDVRLIVKHADSVLYEINAVSVDDVRYHNDSGRETIEIVLSEQSKIWLSLAPSVSIHQSFSDRS